MTVSNGSNRSPLVSAAFCPASRFTPSPASTLTSSGSELARHPTPVPWAFQTTAGIGAGGTFIDTSSANIALNPGDFFVIDISGGPGCCNLFGSTTPYSGGDLYLDLGGQFTDYTQDYGYSMAFQSYMNTAVPEPGRSCSWVLACWASRVCCAARSTCNWSAVFSTPAGDMGLRLFTV